MKVLAAIALGSNLGPPGTPAGVDGREINLRTAVDRMSSLGRMTEVSSFYDTTPVEYLDQPRFLNGALLLETELEPLGLMRGLLEIERGMGRERSVVVAKGPRLIDLDLLLYGDVVMVSTELTLPHPAMHERRFVLEPLAEIAPEMVHPVLRWTVAEMLDRL